MMKEILLINPPLYFSNGIPKSLDVSVPPLGLLYLASYINKYSENFKAKIIDTSVDGVSLDEIGDLIKKSNPFVVGITSMTPQLQGAVELARFVKETVNTEAKVFLGGPHISADKDFIDRYSNIFDYAITGESEKTFLESIEKLLEKKEIPHVQAGENLHNLDSIPFPDNSLIRREKYNKTQSMLFGRGCPFQCYYCSRPSISRTVRYRSVENMIEEIKHVYEYSGGYINFQDDTFTMIRKRVVGLCNAIKKEKLELHWECNTRIDLVDDEILKIMKEAGCESINFGIESGSERVRKEIIHKGNFTNKRIKEVFSLCRKHEIKIVCYFMIGHPTETKEEIELTKKMILKSGLDLLGLSIPTPFPGSPLYNIAENEGVISKDIIDQFAEKKLGEGYKGVYPIYIPEGVSKEYLLSMMKTINRSFYISFRMLFRRIKRNIFSFKALKKDTIDFFSMIFKGVTSRKSYVGKLK